MGLLEVTPNCMLGFAKTGGSSFEDWDELNNTELDCEEVAEGWPLRTN